MVGGADINMDRHDISCMSFSTQAMPLQMVCISDCSEYFITAPQPNVSTEMPTEMKRKYQSCFLDLLPTFLNNYRMSEMTNLTSCEDCIPSLLAVGIMPVSVSKMVNTLDSPLHPW